MSQTLTRYDLAAVLPCQEKFIMCDCAVMESETKIVGLKAVSLGEWFFPGHFPNHPIMPGVLQVEAMNQLAEVLCWKKLDPERKNDIYLRRLKKVKFRRPNNPGDRVFFTVEMTGESADGIEFTAKAENASGVTCQAFLTLSVRPRTAPVMQTGFQEFDKNEKSPMDINQIAALIPHRYPFLLVDYISKIDGPHVIGVKNATTNEPSFRRYRDGYTVMSGSVHPEIVAQAGCILMLSGEANRGKIAYFMAIEESNFYGAVHPGDQLILDVTIPDTKSKFGKGEGCMKVNGEIISQTSMMFAIVDP